jgi:hypothetical protein
MGGSLSTPEPAGIWYRFSVKCDRPTNAAIEKAARKLGLTPTIFVQKHFEQILDGPPVAIKPEQEVEESATRSEKETAKSCGITVSMLRIHRAMKARASQRGTFSSGIAMIEQATGLPQSSIRVMMVKLDRAGLIRRLKGAGRGQCAVYHVHSIGDDA